MRAISSAFCRVAERRWLAVVVVGLISLAARALLLPVLPVPKPAIQDEFGYLLAADTFAHGRLANPSHPLADHFETLQQLSHPTYASKYPPMSSLGMGLAQKLTGEPWVGVWLSIGIMCGALCWALQGWLPATWAFMGALIGLLKIGIVSYWSDSYWGGSWAAIGGALLIGALPRLIRQPDAGVAVAYAAGLAVLANTRPWEGFIFAALCSIWLAWKGGVRTLKAMALPVAMVLVPAGAWMAYYNYRVTGNALEMPYVAHDKQYQVWGPFLWQSKPLRTPDYSNQVVRDFWMKADAAEKQSSRAHWLKDHISDIFLLSGFFLGWPLMVCMIAFARPLWRDPIARFAAGIVLLFYLGALADLRLFPHYMAPAAALAYLGTAVFLRAVWDWHGGSRAVRRYAVAGIFAVFALTSGLELLTPGNRNLFGVVDYHVRAERAAVAKTLEATPGNHLVLVVYGKDHDLYEELVYNRADIDNSKIVWAHSLGEARDSELLRYYGNRSVWVLNENGKAELMDYSKYRKKVLLPTSSENHSIDDLIMSSKESPLFAIQRRGDSVHVAIENSSLGRGYIDDTYYKFGLETENLERHSWAGPH